MRPGSHAAGDGSFGRSAGLQAGRAGMLIGVAVLIGFVLLHRIPGPGRGASASVSPPSTTSLTIRGLNGGTSNTTLPTGVTASTVGLRNPADIKVLVANGTSTPGLAGRVSTTLHTKGYNTLNGTNSIAKPAATVVYFQPSYSSDAASLAAKLGLSPTAVQAMAQPPPVANLNGANILVVVGPDLSTPTSTTSTT